MRVSIVGAAQIVKQYHIHVFNVITGVSIDTVVDLDYDQAQSVASMCGANASTSLSDVAGSDLVFIATPPAARVGIIKNLPSGIKRVVVEKPVGLDLQDLEEINSLAVKKGIEINVAQTRRYFLNLRLCSDLISSGLLGKLKEIHLYEGAILNWNSNSNHLSEKVSPRDKGILQDVGSHLYDWLGMLLNKCEINVDQFKLTKCFADYREMSNTIESEFDGPFKIKSKLSRAMLLSNTVKIVGEKGSMRTRSLLDDRVKIETNGRAYWVRTEYLKSQYSLESAFVAMWEDLLFGSKEDKNFPSLNSVIAGMKLIDESIKEIGK